MAAHEAPAARGAPATPTTYGIVLLPSTEHALVAEEALLGAGLAVRLIPVPRHISSECGMAVRFAWPDRDQAERRLAEVLDEFQLRALW